MARGHRGLRRLRGQHVGAGALLLLPPRGRIYVLQQEAAGHGLGHAAHVPREHNALALARSRRDLPHRVSPRRNSPRTTPLPARRRQDTWIICDCANNIVGLSNPDKDLVSTGGLLTALWFMLVASLAFFVLGRSGADDYAATLVGFIVVGAALAVIADGKHRTGDLGGKAGTREYTNAIIARL